MRAKVCLSAHICKGVSGAQLCREKGIPRKMPQDAQPWGTETSPPVRPCGGMAPTLCSDSPHCHIVTPPQESWFHRKAACLAPGRRPAAVPSPTLAGRDSYPAAAASPFEHLSQHPLSASFLALWNASPQHWPQPPWSQQQAKGQGRQPPASSDNPLALRLAINWPCTDLCGPWRDCLVGFGSSECPRANQRQGQVRLSLLAF